jgi:site-specific DNA recombinase
VVNDIEEIYHDQLKTFLLSGVTISQYLEKLDVELQEKENLLSSISKERELLLKKIDTFIEMRINNELSRDLFIERHRPLEERLQQLNNQLPELQAEIDFLKIHHRSGDVVLGEANDLYEHWGALDFEAKRTIVETITDSIIVGKEDINIKMSYLPSKNPRAADAALKAEKNKDTISNQNPVKRQNDLYGL